MDNSYDFTRAHHSTFQCKNGNHKRYNKWKTLKYQFAYGIQIHTSFLISTILEYFFFLPLMDHHSVANTVLCKIHFLLKLSLEPCMLSDIRNAAIKVKHKSNKIMENRPISFIFYLNGREKCKNRMNIINFNI